MLKKFLLIALASTAAATSANAAVSVSYSMNNVIAPGAGQLVDFSTSVIPNFATSGSGYALMSGTSGLGAAPAGDSSQYLSVYGGNFKMLGSIGYGIVSLYWGSMDTYNLLDLLDAAGNSFKTVTVADIQAGTWADGNQGAQTTNRRVTIASDQAIYGLNVRSNQAAFEIDDVKFQVAVPEPASWAMMVLGFGSLGVALRSRRKARVAFA